MLSAVVVTAGVAACVERGHDVSRPRAATTRVIDAGTHETVDSGSGAAPDDDDDADVSAIPELRLAHNIIVFMGDGMGPEQVAAGRFAAGGRLQLDALAGPALANTDSLTTLRIGGDDAPATDSAAAATVLATGVLVENEVLSQSPGGEPLTTVLELCQRAGKATGLVTTSTFYDASPAAFAVHQPSRSLHVEIATEMLAVTRPEVIMGAGSKLFDSAEASFGVVAADSGYGLVRSAAELEAWSASSRARLLGVFATDFVPVAGGSESFTATPELERRPDSPDPSLAAMTRQALARLSRDPDGFFLFAEDELTDEIGHRAPAELEWAKRAIGPEVMALDAAVSVAIDWVLAHSSFDETLIVVLADHETGGYRFDHVVGPESGDFTAYSEADDGVRVGRHTRTPVEVRALGPGSDSIQRIHSHADTHRLLLGTLH